MNDMVQKETLHLGQKIFWGEGRNSGIVDALTQTGLGIALDEGGYVVARYEDVYGDKS